MTESWLRFCRHCPRCSHLCCIWSFWEPYLETMVIPILETKSRRCEGTILTHMFSLFWFNVASSASGPPASPRQPNSPHCPAFSPCPVPLVPSSCFLGLPGLTPVAQHDAVPSDAQLSRCVQLCQCPRPHVHDLGLGPGSFRLGPPTLSLQDGGPSGWGELCLPSP